MLSASGNTPVSQHERRLILVSAGALGLSAVMTQLALLREMLASFSGNEMVLGIVLGLWLLLMGIGTRLGRTADRFRHPLAALALAQILVAILPLAQVFLLRTLRDVVFVRGASVGPVETVLTALVLLLPYCLAAGSALMLACAGLARAEGPGGIGRAYLADTLGSLAGGAVFSLVLVRFMDHIGILVYPALLNLSVAGAIGIHLARRLLSTVSAVLALALLAGTAAVDPDAVSLRWQYPRQHIVARANSPYGRLIVTESDGQHDFLANGLPLISTRDDRHVEETVHYAMAQRPEARTVLLVSGGISGTANELLKYNVEWVDYVELDPLILELGRRYLPASLADCQIRVTNTDGRLFLKQASGQYDVVIVDVADPSTAQLNRFYTTGFFSEARRALSPDGVLSVSLGHYENYVSPELARMLASAHRSLKESFRNVLMIPGGKVFFLASNGPLHEDIAARIERAQIKTKLVNRHYLDAMLSPDRRADLERAVAQPAALNEDFSPVLYYYHLRHWMSQFSVGSSGLQAVLVLLLCVYLVRLRGPSLVIFASGFAATSLEVVLLLVFQVLCGSVYHQVGLIITVFMAGLAAGVWTANRLWAGTRPGADGWGFGGDEGQEGGDKLEPGPFPSPRDALPPVSTGTGRGPGSVVSAGTAGGKGRLAWLAFALAGYAVLLAFLPPVLARIGGGTGWFILVKTVVALLTFVLAGLVGMQFPLANRLEFDGTVAGASRLYTADFVGACLGALLASTLLIPRIGVAGVCLATAALNFAAALAMRFRKAVT